MHTVQIYLVLLYYHYTVGAVDFIVILAVLHW